MPANTAVLPWYRRYFKALLYSVRWRLTLVFLLLAVALTVLFTLGVQRAASVAWNHMAKPLVTDYIQRLRDNIGSPPNIDVARAITRRLPLTISIRGRAVDWDSSPQAAHGFGGWRAGTISGPENESNPFWVQTSVDGHTLVFGLQKPANMHWPGGWTLVALLLITTLVYRYIRYLLKPLDAIGAGTRRYGEGHFDQAIVLRRPSNPDELDALAQTVNTMGHNIQHMLEAKRALLLAISHELRSPITRARLNTELLPESPELKPQREALLRDLGLMSTLISDLLESERLAAGHSALHCESANLLALMQTVLVDYPEVRFVASGSVGLMVMMDTVRMSLLLRNLLGNAARYAQEAPRPTELHLHSNAEVLEIVVRDFGPGLNPAALEQLGQAFYRPDNARTRSAGGVGLGLYLCHVIAQAHGGSLHFENADPGLCVVVQMPTERMPVMT